MRDLTDNEILALNLYTDFENRDIKKSLEGIETLKDILFELQAHLETNQEQVKPYNRQLITFISKVLLHLNSIHELSKGSIFSLKSTKMDYHLIDIPSIQVLLRTLIETFCMFYFIYRNPKTSDEVEFRYENWMYSGILSRYKFYTKNNEGILKDKKESDELFLERTRSKIEESKFYKKYPQRQRKRILFNGDPRLGNSWSFILKETGINHELSRKIYHVLSSMAHSTGLGFVNLNVMELGYHNKHETGHLYLWHTTLFTSRFIYELTNHLELLKNKYEEMPEEMTFFVNFNAKIFDQTESN